MKVKILKTFVNKNGISILKGRIIDVSEETANELKANGIIEASEKVEKPKKIARK